MDFNRCYGCMKPKTSGPVCQHCGYQEGTANAVHQLPVGTVLKEQYIVGKVLGQGGFGITYLGWDQYLDIPVAIKEYFPGGMVMRESTISLDVVSCGGDDGTRFRNNKERFLREAKVLARFTQVPEIVQIRNFFLTNNTAYIVMEYVEGITLKQYVKEQGGRLSVEETLSILGPVIEALVKVHKTGLVHRDISPDNIMMLPDGGAKLLDFGAVRDVGAAAVDKELTKSTEAILKQGYAPIEQYQKRGSLGPWTDVYALCATIYYCLTGEAPADAPERLLMEEELELEEKVPALTAAQRAALEHGLALRTEQRTGSMQQLKEELLQPAQEPEAAPEPAEKPAAEEKPEPKKEEKPKPAPKREKREQKKPQTEPKTRAAEPQKRKPLEKKPIDAPTAAVTPKDTKPEAEKPVQKKIQRSKNKKRLLPLLALLCAAAAAVVIFVSSFSGDEEITVPFIDKRIKGSCGQNAQWVLDPEKGELVISGSGSTTAYDSQQDNEAPWMEYEDQITALTVTDNIVRLGAYSFSGMDNLKNVTLGSSVSAIEEGAFQRSAVETVLFLPEDGEEEEPSYGIAFIGDGAFRETALRSIELPDSVVTLGSGAFAGCDELVSASVGENALPNFADWEENVFADVSEKFVLQCTSCSPISQYAQTRDIPARYMQIGKWDASGQCGNQLYYHIDREHGLLRISGSGAMWNYTDDDGSSESWDARGIAPWKNDREKIKILILDDGVTSVGQYAFAHCWNLKQISWGSGVRTLAFQSLMNTGVEKVILPNSIQQIENFAFNWCEQLEEIQLPENLPSLEEDAIAECKKLKRVWLGQKTQVKSKWNATPFSCSEDESNTTVYNDLTIYGLQNSPAEKFAANFGYDFAIGTRNRIAEAEGQCGDNAWWFFSGSTLTLYGTGATWKYNLASSDIESWAKWDYQSGRAFTGNPDFWKYQSDIQHVEVLPGLEELGNGMFTGMYNIRSVDFGTITKCYAHFGYNNQLKELTFPESLRVLGGWSFVGSSNLREVTFLGPTTVEEMAFKGCYALKDIWFMNSGTQFRGEIFPMEGTATTNMKQNITFHVRRYSSAENYAKQNDIAYEVIE